MTESLLEQIVTLSGVSATHWQPFRATSPGGHDFAGFLCRHESERLGMLAITEMDGQARLEFIHAMPKIHYPYHRDREGNPVLVVPAVPGLRDARFMQKLDGTAIIFYGLPDAAGRIVEVIPRTRLQPTLRPSRWGDWQALLAEALPDRSHVQQAVRSEGVVLVFELWGHRNPHLVRYETPLALTLHTAIRGGKPLAYQRLHALAERHTLPLVPTLDVTGQTAAELAAAYRRWQDELEARNRAAEGELVEEGAILMLSTDQTALLLKCKPPSIEEIHWQPDQHISREGVQQALLKLVENGYDFAAGRVADVEQLLVADFDPWEVEQAADLIRREYDAFAEEMAQRALLRQRVEASGLSPHELPALMRYLSPLYPKQRMSWVYSTVKQLFGGP